MSFLAGRLAASEGAFFSQTSKQALSRLKEKAKSSPGIPTPTPNPHHLSSPDSNADVLPEILQHSLPVYHDDVDPQPSAFSPSPSSLAASLASSAGEAASPHTSQSALLETCGPLAFLPSVPQTSFGPRRWKPQGDEVKILASTANEARVEGSPTIDDAWIIQLHHPLSCGFTRDVSTHYLHATLCTILNVVKAFLVATALVVGGATVVVGVVGSKLQIHSIDDLRMKGHERMQPRAEAIRQRVEPWKKWAQQRSKNWNMDDNKRDVISGPFAEALGLKQLVTEKVRKS